MAKLKIGDDWWTSPAEGEKGGLIMVTGRRDMESVIATGKYNIRVEVTWKYDGDDKGMPDVATSSLMEEVQDAFQSDFSKDPIAVLTGIYTGENVRNWVFYTLNLKIFERRFNEALSKFDLLPLEISAASDPDWDEYKEMKEKTEIMLGDE